jgi:hypothetical protein
MNSDIVFDDLFNDMQDLMEKINFEDLEECVMCEYVIKYTSIDGNFTHMTTVNQRQNCPADVIQMDGYEEVFLDLMAADIEMDESNTKDSTGRLQHPGCLQLRFTFEDGNAFVVDGIPYENCDDNGQIFTDFVVPVINDYVQMGTITLMEVIEFEE